VTPPHPHDHQSKNNPLHDENNHPTIPQIISPQTTQTHHQQTVYAEENIQVLEINRDIHDECQVSYPNF